MIMKTDTSTLPAYWASYLINGDASGMTDDELVLAHKAEQLLLTHGGWRVVDVARDADGDPIEARFTWAFEIYEGGDASGGDVLDYVIVTHN